MKYKTGNIFDSDAEALVNAVNTVGIMGKGIALQFKERFPTNSQICLFIEIQNELIISFKTGGVPEVPLNFLGFGNK